MPTSTRLRDLVRDIRSARTAAEERAVVNKECALIRDQFREEDNVYRCRNVAKLLYIHMLGYPAHFGQLDCLKLIASTRFTDKRIGYLGAMLLLDERTDIHVLVTNSLKNDLNHSNQYIISLALCTLGSICSIEMSRDLVTEVERLIKSTNVYLRKKAILCAFRMIKRVPDLIELFIPSTRSLLNEKNHGVLIASVTLLTEMCQKSPDTLHYFKRMVPNLVRILKNLIMAGYSPEHDVNGVSDPFLQVKVLKLLRILGKGDHESSDAMNDILAQVATNTDTSKNVGHAILYEIVLTIMGVESEAGLRVLAVNILGRFLLNNDKNIRYVALNTLQQVVNVDYKAVQRHRSTIVDCLMDPDISIQRRAMELCFVLINASNIRGMCREMLLYLQKSCVGGAGVLDGNSGSNGGEFKSDCCSSLVVSAEKYAPNVYWHVETMLQLLATCGNYARDDVIFSLAALISQNTGVGQANISLQQYAVVRLYSALRVHQNHQQQPLIQIAAWCIGEYATELLNAKTEPPVDSCYDNPNSSISMATSGGNDLEAADHSNSNINNGSNTTTGSGSLVIIPNCKLPVSELQLVQLLESQLFASTNIFTKQMIQMALMKLSTRLRDDKSINTVRQILNVHCTSIHLELQQRSVEFSAIFKHHDALRTGLLESMPTIRTSGAALSGTHLTESSTATPAANISSNQALPASNQINNGPTKSGAANDLLDLLNDTPAAPITANGNSIMNSNDKSSFIDLLGDLSLKSEVNGGTNTEISSKVLGPNTVYESTEHGLRLQFTYNKLDATRATIRLAAQNTGTNNLSRFMFQAAVPKSFQLTLQAPSGDNLEAQKGQILQEMSLHNPTKQPWKMKIRLEYQLNGLQPLVTVMHQLNSFPEELWC